MGGRRLSEEEKNFEGEENADYLLPGAVAELKTLEEERLEKQGRQNRAAEVLVDNFCLPPEVNVDIRSMPESARAGYRKIIGAPI